MATPDQYRASSANRVSTATGLSVIDGRTGAVTPIREASPESDDAEPLTEVVISRGEGFVPGYYMGGIAANTDPNLLKDAQGLKLYDKLLSDETAMSCLQQRRLAITSRDWEVAPGDDKDPLSVRAAEDFRAMLADVGFDRVTGLLHYGVWYGFAVAEAVWTTKQHDGRSVIWLDDVVVPDRRHFAFTNEGALRYVGEMGMAGEGGELPDNKFMTIRTGGTHDFAFYGLGLAHWCYWPIFFKRSGLKFWSLNLEKFGAPTVVIGFSEAQKDDKKAKAQLLQAAAAITRDSAVAVPADVLTNNLIKIMETERTGAGGSGFKEFCDAQDEAIMRVVLGQPGTSKGVASGLNSDQAGTHADVKAEIVKADSDLISEAINRTFAKWVTAWNYGPNVAPPKVFRVLDDAEDLGAVAERDVALDGIGIKRTEDSVKEIYGDGYEVDRLSTEQQQAREDALVAAKAGATPAAAGGNVIDIAAERRKRVAEFAAQGGETAFSPLYVSRKLLNADEVLAWARKQGLKNLEASAELHVTVLYSKEAVDWFKMAGEGWDWAEVTVEKGGPRFIERFGDALVLRFASSSLSYRHDSMIERGASSDFPDYKPHVTITYDGADVDLAAIEPFVGELRFGPEIFEPIKADGEFRAEFDSQFSASEDEAIDGLIAKLVEEGSPVFEAMAGEMRDAIAAVQPLPEDPNRRAEAIRVALLGAFEALPIERLAKLTALPLLAERAAASVGADEDVVG